MCFNSKIYFPNNKIQQYNASIDFLLLEWLQKFLETSGDKFLNRNILETLKEKNEFIFFLIEKTQYLFDKIVSENNNKIHMSSIKSIFLVCFFIAYKTFTGIDYEILYRTENESCCCNLNLRCLSKAIPEKNDEENIKIFKQIEKDIMEKYQWTPFKLNEKQF